MAVEDTVENDGELHAAQEGPLVLRELLGRPAVQVALRVSANPDRPLAETAQKCQALAWERPGADVAADEHHVRRLVSHVGEHRLESREVPVDVVERRDAH